MALVCAISNEVPESPVVSPASGSVFERRLIEKYLNENGNKDPINGEQLSTEMLIDIKTPPFVKAKPPTATSIPAILKSLQDEWDAVMLHSFTMRQQLQTARQELSHALYQHDAACRVIARLTKEVAGAREALATLKPQQPSTYISGAPLALAQANFNEAVAPSAIEVVGINNDVQIKLQETAQVLTLERKKKGKLIPEDLRSSDQIADFKVLQSHTGLHSVSTPGIMCLDVAGSRIVTGGNDKGVTVFNKDTEQMVAVLKGHTKKVVAVACHPSEDIVLSGSFDSTVRVWNVSSGQTVQLIRAHEAQITGLSLHATGDYVLSSSMDRSWAFSDLRTGAILAKVTPDERHAPTSAKFHPDGLIFATGTTNADVKIWDLKEQTNVADFPGHTGTVTSMSFSENGYYLATAAEDYTVRLWDLRKLKNFKTITMEDNYNIVDLAFDQSGTYLAFIGNDLRIYNSKTWNPVVVFNEHTAMGTGVRFGQSASFIVSSSMDRTLKIYG